MGSDTHKKRLRDQQLYQDSYVNELSDIVHKGKPNLMDRLKHGLSKDTYGTEYGPSAKAARDKAVVQRGYTAYNDEKVRKKTREAGAEERRESRGYKSGGSVRGCGIARKGHGKGTMR